MKRTLLYGIFAAAIALVSCNKSEMDPLSGYFPEATVLQYTALSALDASVDEADRRVFTIDLTDGTTPMHLTLIGNKYYLTANQYTEALDAVAKNGNFILGKSTVGGLNIKQGFVTVEILEEKETDNGCENTYSISTVLFLEDGTPYKTYWTGTLAFEKDAVMAPDYYFTDTVAQDCTDDANNLYTDVESHTLFLNDASGNFAAQIKLIRKVGTKNLAGTYTVKEYAHEDLTAGNGFDLGVYFGMDPGAYVIGSYYVSNGSVVIINPGETITVTDMGDGIYSIDGNGFSFLTAPEGYVPGAGPTYEMTDVVAQDCTDDANNLYTDVESHTLSLKDDDGQLVAQIKLVRSVGTTDLCGTYTVKEYAHEDLTAGNGFDLGVYFGMDPGAYIIGSYYIKDGTAVIIEPGETITVSSVAENIYKFEGSTDYVFVGKLVQGDTPGPGPDPGDNVELKEFLSLTDYSVYGMKMVGIELGTAGFSYTAPDYQTTWTPSYPVDGQFIKLELYSEDGTIAPGTYVPSAANGTVNPGEFNLGADNGWGGFNGTSWFTVTSGAATGAAVTDGTVTVSKEGNIYTIEIKTSAVNAKYVGKLSDEAEPAVELSSFLSLTSYAVYGMKMVGIELGTPGFSYTAPDYQTSWTPSYPVDGQFIKLELYSEDGTVAPGTYVPSAANGTVNAGEFNLGADNGWGGFNGTSWFTVASGAATGVAVTDGTVTVAQEGEVYTIEIKTTAVNAKYVGKLSK